MDKLLKLLGLAPVDVYCQACGRELEAGNVTSTGKIYCCDFRRETDPQTGEEYYFRCVDEELRPMFPEPEFIQPDVRKMNPKEVQRSIRSGKLTEYDSPE